ncbi:MAG: hypothetical protein JNM93_07565 [Bacteriovoracaceae bacterium]|nr:hypothetical protein [Bacteriovoracaceae bacterium]
MKKLLIGVVALCSLSAFADFSTRVSSSMSQILNSNEFNEFINKNSMSFVGIKYRAFGTQQRAHFSLQVYAPYKGEMKVCDYDVVIADNSVAISDKKNCERDNNKL